MPVIILVGEMNPYGVDPSMAQGKRSKEVVWISGEEWTPRITLFNMTQPTIHVKRIV